MIVKFFKSNNNPKATINYLCGKERDREQSRLLEGDIELSLRVAESLEFSNRYTVGCLSFEEDNIQEEQKREIIERFENTFLAGLEKDQYNILWVEHRDKGRVELNFFIPNVELKTNKRLQPYYDKADRPLAENFKQVINHEYQFSDPNEPIRAQVLISRGDLPKDKKEALEAINDGLMGMIKEGSIKNRDDIITALTNNGFEIARVTNKNISIKTEGQNLRLKGAFYEQDFRFSKELSSDIGERNTEYQRSSEERYKTARERLDSAISRQQQKHREKYQDRTIKTYQENNLNVQTAYDNRINVHDYHRVNDNHSNVSSVGKLQRHDGMGGIGESIQSPIEKYIDNELPGGVEITAVRSNRQEIPRPDLGGKLQDSRDKGEVDDASNGAFRESIERIIATAKEYTEQIISKIRSIGEREQLDEGAIQANNGAIGELKQNTAEVKKAITTRLKGLSMGRGFSRGLSMDRDNGLEL